MKNSKIKNVKAREILDSRGNPTVEVELETDGGSFLASVPSGTSKGKYEALELRDGGKRYHGMGVLKAVRNVNNVIGPKLKGKDVTKQKEIDEFLIKLDGTENKSKLGANAICGVSTAVCRAGAAAKKMPLWKWISKIAGTKPSLPAPSILLIEGGLHGPSPACSGAKVKKRTQLSSSRGRLDVQEFMAVSQAKSFREEFRMGTEIYHILGEILAKKYEKKAADIGMERAFTPPFKKTKEALDLIMEAVDRTSYKAKIILDVAASFFYRNGKYYFEGKKFDRGELLKFYSELCQKYPIMAIEDPFAQEDWKSFQKITKKFGKRITIIGDDLLVTNIQRIKKAVKLKACNGLILKTNQIGTVSETIEAAKYAIKNKWKVFVKHRSGETQDDFIADLSVGLGMGWIMAGAPNKEERMAKYNRLLRIGDELK